MSNTKTPDQVDVRGPRFAAWITTAVLVVTLLVSGASPLAAAIILLVRGTIYPLLLNQMPPKMLDGLDAENIRILSYSAAAAIFASPATAKFAVKMSETGSSSVLHRTAV